jgi:4-hydroxybenzoate polyprenyltransferase
MNWQVALRLGRVSNLPTVWTNTLAAIVLAGGEAASGVTLPLIVATSLAYVGGMYLNDAFDAEIDARERPERPIPAGRVARATVFQIGFAMLGASVVLLGIVGMGTGTGLRPPAAGLALAGLIFLYNRRHKDNPASPLIMGLCRVFVYIAAGLCVAFPLPQALWLGAAALLFHLIGLTYAAKQGALDRIGSFWPIALLALPLAYGVMLAFDEPPAAIFLLALAAVIAIAVNALRRRGPGDIGFSVTLLIAAISLLDAMLIAGQGRLTLAVIAALGFPLTLILQRWVRGT